MAFTWRIAIGVLCVSAGLFQAPSSAQTQVAPAGMTVQSVRAKLPANSADFTGLPALGQGQLYNGVAADPGQWPATLVSQPSGCTATLVGPRILLTAAHCVMNGASVTFLPNGFNKSVEADCMHHWDYSADYDANPSDQAWAKTSADYAVCVVKPKNKDGEVQKDIVGVPFEVVGAGPLFGTGERVRLLGFGCNGTTIDSAGYGMLRTAGSGIESVPSPPVHYFVTDWSKGGFGHAKGGVVCPGDSGGAVYWPMTSGARRIVALNSRTGVGPDGRTLIGKSYLSSTLTPRAFEFLDSFSIEKTGGICGVKAGVQGCRQ